MKIIRLALYSCLMIIIIGCASTSRWQVAVNNYHAAADQIKLGDTKETVFSTLNPGQAHLPPDERKRPDVYKKGEVLVEILYFLIIKATPFKK